VIGVMMFDDGLTDHYWIDGPKVYHTTVVSDRIIGCLERLKSRILLHRNAADLDQEVDPDGVG